MRGINYTALWIKALYKCSRFTIYHPPEPLDPAEDQGPPVDFPLNERLSGRGI